jgi:soluble lytic murein transglycosylase-like protein
LQVADAAALPPVVEAAGRSPDLLPSASCQLNPAYSQNILQWCEYITSYSEKNGLAPNLVAALILQESGGDALAYSRSGAVGLMQVMPRDGLAAAFTCINGPCFASRPTTAELQDPEFNIEYGTRLLAGLLARHANDLREALRAYGPMDVGYRYADTVLAIYERYR